MGCVLTYMVFIRKGVVKGYSLTELCPHLHGVHKEGGSEGYSLIELCPHLQGVHKEGGSEGVLTDLSCVFTCMMFTRKGNRLCFKGCEAGLARSPALPIKLLGK